MSKLLIVYKDEFPAIVDHSLESIVKTTFILIHKTDKFAYQRLDFGTLDDALDYESEKDFKLVFIYLESEDEVEFRNIEFSNNKLIVKDELVYKFDDTEIFVSIDFDNVRILKRHISGKPKIFNSNFERREEIDDKYFSLEDYYELIPHFDDLFLEVSFLYDVVTTKKSINDWSEMEAHLLFAKTKVESNGTFLSKNNEEVSA